MTNFYVGDLVRALPSSNNEYMITNEKNSFIGRVISVRDDGILDVITVSCSNREININSLIFSVNRIHFEKVLLEYEKDSPIGLLLGGWGRMKQIEIISFSNRENTLFYVFDKKYYANTYDVFSLKEVLSFIINENDENTFIDLDNLFLSIKDYYNEVEEWTKISLWSGLREKKQN